MGTKLRNELTVKMNFIKKHFSSLICHTNSYNLNSDLSPINFVKWILPLFFLTASCLTPIYAVPFFASVPHINCPLNPNCTLEIEASLKVTVFDHFDSNWWNGFNWIKLVFFIGFAVSHFSVGFLGDYFGKWNVFKFLVKTLILASLLTSLTNNIFIFSILWFVIAYCSTASYPLVVCTVLETVDSVFDSFRYRILIGIIFQMSWTTGMLVICSTITLLYFVSKKTVWKSKICQEVTKYDTQEEFSFSQFSQTMKFSYINILVLSLTWFNLGYNYYGIMNTWRFLSRHGKIFQQNILGSLLALLAKILALMVCISVKRKRLPLCIFQLLTSVIYVCLVWFDSEDFYQDMDYQINSPSVKYVFLVHLSALLEAAAFALIWVITPECFPKRYRTTCVGFCSGFARIGAITGIVFSEFNILFLNAPVLLLARALAFLSSILVPFLPEMTKHKMPETYQDIQKVQFPREESDSRSPT